MPRRSVGIDVGGTFTDLVAVAADGTVETRKVLSTPADQSQGVEDAIDALGVGGAEVERIVHGTTVATNMLLERAGARVLLCATRGAADLLELRRQERASLYDLALHHPPPLVDADAVLPVAERVEPGGVARALDDVEARRVAEAAAARRPDIVAVALLHSYAEPAHERRLAVAIADRLPGTDIVLSSDVLPEIREYERTATTVAEAYLRPGVSRYVRRLAERLATRGLPSPGVMTSSGGMRRAEQAATGAASLALSGPAGGVVGAAAVARAAGFGRALTIDIGGTSADVGLVLDGEPMVEPGGVVAGVPLALPRVLVETVSAGGGSLAWIDDGGALRVGPRSAGAVPGPAAFGRGGSEATVTDAHIALGRIRAAHIGALRLEAAAAREAVERLARRLGAEPRRTAEAIVVTADAAMARALRRVSVERGVDPRDCVLVAFGGGGPLHACGLAELLGMGRVLVPPHAGVLSALGLAMVGERREEMASVMRDAATLQVDELAARLESLRRRAGGDGAPAWWARARYVGQGHELSVPVKPGDDGETLAREFAALHSSRIGFALDRPVEVVSVRFAATAPGRTVRLARGTGGGWDPSTLVDDGGAMHVELRGPASVSLPDATMFVAPRWRARALPEGGWLLERDE